MRSPLPGQTIDTKGVLLAAGAPERHRLKEAVVSEPPVPSGKLMVDPYLDWIKRECIPVHEDFGLDLLQIETRPWARFGVNGAIAHVKGRGDFMTVFLLDIPPGGRTSPQRHLFEHAVLVLSGHGST